MNIQAIASDLDDTLLNEHGALSALTVEVLQTCIRRGIHVIPASGRTQVSLRPYAEAIGVDCPYIACNGAQIISQDDRVLMEETFSPELAKEICRYLQAEGFYVQVYQDDYFYYEAECENARKYKHSSGMAGKAVGDLQAFVDFPVPKVLSINDPAEVQRVLPLIQKRFEGVATFTLSKPFFIEAVAPNVTKGGALQKVTEGLGIAPENVMAFGDSLNDISLFTFAGHGVAMGNGREEAKKAARYLCPPNTEDGVARFILDRVLNP